VAGGPGGADEHGAWRVTLQAQRGFQCQLPVKQDAEVFNEEQELQGDYEMPSNASELRIASNLSASQVAVLAAALGWRTTQATFDGADLIVLEPRHGEDLTDPQVATIKDRVRQGATLMVALPASQQLSSMLLGEVLPALTWQASDRYRRSPASGAIQIGWADPEFYHSALPKNISLPFFSTVEPMSSIQRGQSRYAIYKRNTPVLLKPVEPGDQLWTRPLLMRDVRIRLRGSDNAATPLMVTGCYGAGRTVLFGSGFDQLAGNQDLLQPVLAWLNPSSISTVPVATVTPELTVTYGKRSIEIRLRQNSDASLPVEIVGRAYTWENAPLGFEYDLLKSVILHPAQTAAIEMTFPQYSEIGYQALGLRDAFHVHVAILGSAGANLLLERQMLADFSDQTTIDVFADDIDHWDYPFDAPGTSFQKAFTDRCGARIGAYAYPPGAKLNGLVVISNGLQDLGPLAVVADETTPGNPSASALVDGSMVANKKPSDAIAAYSMWYGNPNAENVLSFTFPHPVTLASITLVGSYKEKDPFNPDGAILELDGKRLASGINLVEHFCKGSGNVVFDFAPVTGTQMKLRIPASSGPIRSRGVALTEVQFEGWAGPTPAPVSGELTVALEDAHSGMSVPVLNQAVALKPGERRQVVVSSTLPDGNTDGSPAFFRLHANFDGVSRSAPILVLNPLKPLLPNSALVPPNAPELGFIVTQGYRVCFPLGTGTAEHPPGWATPDDLIWAYSRQLKEVSRTARTEAGRLYVTEGDMRHYAAPWRTFLNGVPLFDEATPNLVDAMSKQPRWNDSKIAKLGNSDRWETGPQIDTLHGWQDFVEFDAHLRAAGKSPLKGRTREEIAAEIHNEREDEWQAWQFSQYLHNFRTLRDGFAARGKRLLITAQGCPVIAGPAAEEIAETIQGMSDDSTWDMAEGSQSLTVGRQMAILAHNPVWKMSTLLEYGFVSNTLNSPEWHAPVCTVEPLRRLYYDRAWRATIWHDGEYRSVYTAGYNENVGISYQMAQNDWEQWWRIEERHSLLTPQQPIGAGIVISTIRFADPNHFRFNADYLFSASPDGLGLARVFQRLHEAGLSIPFVSNATALGKWKGSAPLIVLNPEVFVDEEIATLEKLKGSGVRMVAFSSADSLEHRLHALFETPGSIIKLDPKSMTSHDAEDLLPRLQELLNVPLAFSKGACGYGFRMSGMQFIVVGEWRNQGHIAQVRLRATGGKIAARACGLNDHSILTVRRDGTDWVIDVPLRPGDGQVVVLSEI
jgi:hypothetical protein